MELEDSKDLAREAWIMNATIVLDSLYGKLSALKLKISNGWGGCHESAYRQHSQERGFPSILQPDHCYIHFGCPVRTTSTVNAIRDYDMSFSCPEARMEAWFQEFHSRNVQADSMFERNTYQKSRNSQS